MASVGMPISYKRLGATPLEDCMVFTNIVDGDTGYQQAVKYASGDAAQHADAPIAYVGQVLAAQSSDGTWSAYIIQNTRLLQRIGDMPNTTFTAANLTENDHLIVASNKPPRAIQNTTTKQFFNIGVESLTVENFYDVDLSGLTIEGEWELIY